LYEFFESQRLVTHGYLVCTEIDFGLGNIEVRRDELCQP